MKRLLALFLALVICVLPVSALAAELPESDCEFTFTKEELEEMFSPEKYKEFWENLENDWENPDVSWGDLEISWEEFESFWEEMEIPWEGPEITVEDILNLKDLYEDLDPTRWYWNAVEFCLESGLMQGLEMNLFGPNEATTRAQLVTILWRLDGSPWQFGCSDLPFEDVKAWDWYAQAVCWAYQNEIVAGLSENSFAPNDPVTREQLVTMLYNYSVKNGLVSPISEWEVKVAYLAMRLLYSDYDESSEWARAAIVWASTARIMKGDDSGKLAPKASATRAQIATVFYNFCNITIDEIE